MAKPHKFYCWMRVIKRSELSEPIEPKIPSKPPKKRSAENTNTSDFNEEWVAIEPYYNRPIASTYVLDYWSGNAFSDKDEALTWASQEGKAWVEAAHYITLMQFDVKPKRESA